MTLRELNEQFKLRDRLARAKELLSSLEHAASPSTQLLTGMPHAPGVRDRVGDLASEIADLKTSIKELEAEIEAQKMEAQTYISAIEDNQIRTIFNLRFMHGLSWTTVADIIGGHNNSETVKRACYRYIESCPAMSRNVP